MQHNQSNGGSVADRQESAERMREWALHLAARGLAVFPLKPESKAPLTPNGFKDSSTDPERVEALFWPRWDGLEKGIGIDCGASGLMVVDLDGPEGLAQRDRFPDTLTVVTSHGVHMYYRGEGRCTTRALGDGIDTKGAGGYVVAPPTQVRCDKEGHDHFGQLMPRYKWEDPQVPVADLPEWVGRALAPRPPVKRKSRKKVDPESASLSLWASVERFKFNAVPGARNDALNRECFTSRDLESHELLAPLWYEQAMLVGLESDESIRTIASALGRDASEVASWL